MTICTIPTHTSARMARVGTPEFAPLEFASGVLPVHTVLIQIINWRGRGLNYLLLLLIVGDVKSHGVKAKLRLVQICRALAWVASRGIEDT